MLSFPSGGHSIRSESGVKAKPFGRQAGLDSAFRPGNWAAKRETTGMKTSREIDFDGNRPLQPLATVMEPTWRWGVSRNAHPISPRANKALCDTDLESDTDRRLVRSVSMTSNFDTSTSKASKELK